MTEEELKTLEGSHDVRIQDLVTEVRRLQGLLEQTNQDASDYHEECEQLEQLADELAKALSGAIHYVLQNPAAIATKEDVEAALADYAKMKGQ